MIYLFGISDYLKNKITPMFSLFSSDFRKDLNIEKERQTIREPVLSKKRKKIPPISTETSSGNSSNEKRLKKLQPPSSNPSSSTTTNSEFKKFFVKWVQYYCNIFSHL